MNERHRAFKYKIKETREMIQEKIETLCRDESFAEKFKKCETAQEISDLFASEGVIVSADEIDTAYDAINAEGEVEFSEDELDNVAGGIFISGGAFLAYSVIYSAITLQSAYTLGKANRKRK
jgi:hypothetical protein